MAGWLEIMIGTGGGLVWVKAGRGLIEVGFVGVGIYKKTFN
jgi:hypothetical protein